MSRFQALLAAILPLLLAACADEETLNPLPTAPSYGGTLALEIRGTADLTLRGTTPETTTVSLKLTGAAAPHLLDDGTLLEGPGRFEPFPETGSDLFVAKLSLPPDPEGPCAAAPRSIALALHHRVPTSRFAGALTVYCGEAHHGVPVRVFRLSGTLDPR